LSDIPPLQSPPLARNFERQNSGEHEISTSPIRSKNYFRAQEDNDTGKRTSKPNTENMFKEKPEIKKTP